MRSMTRNEQLKVVSAGAAGHNVVSLGMSRGNACGRGKLRLENFIIIHTVSNNSGTPLSCPVHFVLVGVRRQTIHYDDARYLFSLRPPRQTIQYEDTKLILFSFTHVHSKSYLLSSKQAIKPNTCVPLDEYV